jgi:ABC-2 type transport system permease protein
MGSEWPSDPFLPAALVVATALLLVDVLVPDAFAGERERRTLMTLLASPLADRAILFGKVLVPVLINLGTTVGLLALSVIIVNVTKPGPTVQLFVPALTLGLPVLSLLVGLFTGTLGVFISLRSSTIQTAQQVLLSALMAPLMIGSAVFMALATSGGPVPDWLTNLDLGAAMLTLCLGFAVIDAALLALVTLLFRRSRLITLR